MYTVLRRREQAEEAAQGSKAEGWAELAEEVGQEEAKAKAEEERLASVKAEADARRAARQAKWAEQQAQETSKAEASSVQVATETNPTGAATQYITHGDDTFIVSSGDGWDGENITTDTPVPKLPPAPVMLSEAACKERRCVRVDNVGHHSSEDDVRMLMEGFGRINAIHKYGQHGWYTYAIEYADSLSAEDACSERAIGSHKGTVLASRQLLVAILSSAAEATMPRGGAQGRTRFADRFADC